MKVRRRKREKHDLGDAPVYRNISAGKTPFDYGISFFVTISAIL